LDLEAFQAKSVCPPGGRQLLGLASQGKNRSYALCRGDAAFYLFGADGNGWDMEAFPYSQDYMDESPILVANSEHLVVLTSKYAYRRTSHGSWERTPIKPAYEINQFLRYLFHIDARYQDNLDRQNISDDLRQRFRDAGRPLSLNASVVPREENREWLIADTDYEQTYLVLGPNELETELRFFRYTLLDAKHYLLAGNQLYIARDRGEWGGDLNALNILTGDWEPPVPFSRPVSPNRRPTGDGTTLPIRDMKLDSAGKLWVIEFMDHMSSCYGYIRAYDGNSWEVFAKSNAWQNREEEDSRCISHASVHSISFDKAGTPYLLAWTREAGLGLFKYQNGEWEQVALNLDNAPSGADFLHMVDDNTVVIGFFDDGVAVLDIKSGNMRRILLGESFYDWK